MRISDWSSDVCSSGLEQLVKGRGWLEFSVYPLYSPQSLIAEGTANYGIDLAFPDKTRPDTERDVLMPLAEIEPPANDRYWRLLDAMTALQGARLTIAQRSLDGELDRPAAVPPPQTYLLFSPPPPQPTAPSPPHHTPN